MTTGNIGMGALDAGKWVGWLIVCDGGGRGIGSDGGGGTVYLPR